MSIANEMRPARALLSAMLRPVQGALGGVERIANALERIASALEVSVAAVLLDMPEWTCERCELRAREGGEPRPVPIYTRARVCPRCTSPNPWHVLRSRAGVRLP
jgi:hypothetical protein